MPSGCDSGTRLAVCIRRIRRISDQSDGADKVVVASLAFGSSVTSSPLKDALVHALKQEKISAVCVSGSQAEQAEAIRRFDDDPDIRVLLLDMRSSYSGVTLTAANHLVLLDPFRLLPDTQQIIARISRQGQRKPCFVYHMCAAGTVEEAILFKREHAAAERQQPLAQVADADQLLPAGAAVEVFAHDEPQLSVPAATSVAATPSPDGAEGGAAAPSTQEGGAAASSSAPSSAPSSSSQDATKRPRSPGDGASCAPSPVHAAAPAAASPLSPLPAAAKTFAQQLRDAGVAYEDAALDHLVALGRWVGVNDMDDLRDLDDTEVRASVAHMQLTPLQMNKLLKALRVLGTASPAKVPRLQ